MEKIIAQAAEAIIIKQGNKIIKRRIKKGYRLPELDNKLRKLRTRTEARLIQKAPVPVPKIINIDEKKAEIEMQFIDGKKLSENLDSLSNKEEVMQIIGQETSKLHDANIIHGDLTTSNMILVDESKDECRTKIGNIEIANEKVEKAKDECRTKLESLEKSDINNNKSNFKVFYIDFGLGFTSSKVEDKAVDIHLLKQALEARHFLHHEKLFQAFLKAYNPQNKQAIIQQLKKVELRGRYRKNAQ